MTVFHTVGVCAGVDQLGLGPRRGEEFAGPLGFLPLVFHPWIAYLDIIASTWGEEVYKSDTNPVADFLIITSSCPGQCIFSLPSPG